MIKDQKMTEAQRTGTVSLFCLKNHAAKKLPRGIEIKIGVINANPTNP